MNPNVFSQRKPKLYSSIYDQSPKPLNASTMPPAGAIGQSSTGQYIYPQQPKKVEPKPEPVQPELTVPQQKINLQTETANQQAKYIKDLFANRAKTYQNQIPGMESRFNQYKQEQENAIREAEKATEQEKLTQEELYGGELRQSAQTGREGRARVANQFAGYNTLDSSAYGQALVNQEDALRREQAGIRSQQTRAGLQSQRELSQFKREANNAIASEASKLQDRINEINAVLGEGSIEADNEIAKAYQTARENILNIKQSLLSTENELNKYKVSQSYLQTGVPSTMADYIFRQSEPEKAQKFEEMLKAGMGGQQNKQSEVLNVVERLLAGNTDAISGGFRYAIPGTEASNLANDFEGLKSLLALARRGELKGSGAVSDFEAKMLERAALAGLDRTNSEAVFRQRLQQLANDLKSQGAVSPSGSGINMSQFVK